MKNLKVFMYLSSLSFMILGCSSNNKVMHSNNVVHVSEEHLYNENYGFYQNDVPINEFQNEFQEEQVSMNSEWTTNLTKDPDTFYAHEYVQKDDVITYKYKFDKKFYDHAEWRSAEF